MPIPSSSPSVRTRVRCDARSASGVVHCWPSSGTYCRGSSQIGQDGGGDVRLRELGPARRADVGGHPGRLGFQPAMTRLSGYFLPTEKQAPADAEALSHRLLVRAGMVRQVGAGLWSWLPAGWRVHQRIVQIVREEMNAIGGQELLMPVLNPAELWQKSGRYQSFGAELFRFEDRRGAPMVLATTHEEVVTMHVAQVVRSYRDLPFILYHFQVKERDEPRPRAGVLRTREFVMKDAYTFDRDPEGLDVGYGKHIVAYDRIFDRVGLEWYRVESDVGAMGGSGAHEYMAPCPAGENDVALAPGYAANVEVASADAAAGRAPAAARRARAGAHARHDHHRRRRLPPRRPARRAAEGLPGHRGRPRPRPGHAARRPPRQRHQAAQRAAGGVPPRPPGGVRRARSARPGFIGPVGAQAPILLDDGVARPAATSPAPTGPTSTCAASSPAATSPSSGSTRGASSRATPWTARAIRVEPAIEVGNIFKLGTRYSEPLGATYLDEAGRAQPIWMGSYGIGPARIAAAAVEQFADEQGIAWPRAIAPWDVELVGLGRPGTEERALADRLYDELRAAGLDAVYDDRDAGPGEKFADAELLGVPLRLTVGRRTAAAGEVEAQVRRGREGRSVPLEGAAAAAADLWRSLP